MPTMIQASTDVAEAKSNADRRHKTAAALLEKWMLEDDSYDDCVWSVLEQELRDSALRCRETDELGA
jgi:hypothetical protein